ncbi:hypothetical protein MVES_003653 [Malassezia vespertilionis]|uniref:GH16 domain-containing protein n=2 Tax=Malassezia vespertilionis TaxID=2020962 RepID=A0A2N1J7D2_9BASI|nr:hypothetical protein MVES_003653 [Malassezia vespertilionis]
MSPSRSSSGDISLSFTQDEEPDDSAFAIMDSYAEDAASNIHSVFGEAIGGSRASTALRNGPYNGPTPNATPSLPALPFDDAYSRAQMASNRMSTHVGVPDGVPPFSPERVYHRAFTQNAGNSMPVRYSLLCDYPTADGAQRRSMGEPSTTRFPMRLSSTKRRSEQRESLTSTNFDTFALYGDNENDALESHAYSRPNDEFDLINAYDDKHDTHNTTNDIFNVYAGSLPSTPERNTLVHRRHTGYVSPSTPVYSLRHSRMRRDSMASAFDSEADLHAAKFAGASLGGGEEEHANLSMLSMPDQSTDKFIRPHDDTMELQGGDDEWDERKLKGKEHMSLRGFANVGMIVILVLALLMLFLGYPLLTAYRNHRNNLARSTLMNVNDDGDVEPLGTQNLRKFSLLDRDTPQEALTRKNLYTGQTMKLVFSDEFNVPGRSFNENDDPFWLAEDLHYWQTENYEWYDPGSITTVQDPDNPENGFLQIKLSENPIHGLNFRGGLLTSWNKMCFTGGYVEASVMLPGQPNATGFWPAVWTMGNLGRAGYGATTDGVWPYSYDTCDVGTMPNQTYLASQGGGPIGAETSGEWIDQYGPSLSFLPGQRLSRCTCGGSDHPGPFENGQFKGRSAPEIDILEASANNGDDEHGQVSMSLQVAPFNFAYNLTGPNHFKMSTDKVHNATRNSYTGSAFQQAISAKVNVTDTAYEMSIKGKPTFLRYGYEYKPGYSKDGSYIMWTVDGKQVALLEGEALGADDAVEIADRPIPEEPMYLLMNLGIASSFSWINWDVLMQQFEEHNHAARMRVDYIRVYQDEDKINVGCDPPGFPTKAYIDRHIEAYTNSELTSWTLPKDKGGYNQPFPGNSLMGQC